MKRLLLLSLVALFGASLVRAEATRADLADRVESCRAILEEFQRGPHAIPTEILKRAQAIVIVNQFKGAFLLGIKDGYGVILVRKPNGGWSLPVLISAGEASLGLQVGATAVEEEAGWNAAERAELQATIAARQPFLDFPFSRVHDDGSRRTFIVSGEPMFNQSCRFIGYRGIGVERTAKQ